jgi:hypothetical protein
MFQPLLAIIRRQSQHHKKYFTHMIDIGWTVDLATHSCIKVTVQDVSYEDRD